MGKLFDLHPHDRQKSFYGKARLSLQENGDTILFSYNTPVCEVTANKQFVRLWSGYSATTMKHINAFLAYMGIEGGGKAWWDKQEVEAA